MYGDSMNCEELLHQCLAQSVSGIWGLSFWYGAKLVAAGDCDFANMMKVSLAVTLAHCDGSGAH
jgi:hypothetical protein